MSEETKQPTAPAPPKPEDYRSRVRKMNHRQLRGELRRLASDPAPGLTAIYGIVFGTILENTKTRENPFAKLQAYPR
jgi:hypothetical protein